jgi:hypothetical protein
MRPSRTATPRSSWARDRSGWVGLTTERAAKEAVAGAPNGGLHRAFTCDGGEGHHMAEVVSVWCHLPGIDSVVGFKVNPHEHLKRSGWGCAGFVRRVGVSVSVGVGVCVCVARNARVGTWLFCCTSTCSVQEQRKNHPNLSAHGFSADRLTGLCSVCAAIVAFDVVFGKPNFIDGSK